MFYELWMNLETGELVPASRIIKDFYKHHGGLEDWRQGWEFSGMYDETSVLQAPDFAGVVNV